MAQKDKTQADAPNADLKVDAGSNVADSDEVKAKTTPNLREETSANDSKRFERDFTILLDGDTLTPELQDRQETAVRQEAVQRGLVPTGPVRLDKTEDIHVGGRHSVRLVYSVAVDRNGPDADVLPGVAVAEQPDDTPADTPERRKGGKEFRERVGDRRTDTVPADQKEQ